MKNARGLVIINKPSRGDLSQSDLFGLGVQLFLGLLLFEVPFAGDCYQNQWTKKKKKNKEKTKISIGTKTKKYSM